MLGISFRSAGPAACGLANYVAGDIGARAQRARLQGGALRSLEEKKPSKRRGGGGEVRQVPACTLRTNNITSFYGSFCANNGKDALREHPRDPSPFLTALSSSPLSPTSRVYTLYKCSYYDVFFLAERQLRMFLAT
eukprot:641134-Prorocentrum_minimum.AAC.2